MDDAITAAISGGAGLVGALVGGWLSRQATLSTERERQRFAREQAEADDAARLTSAARVVLEDLVMNGPLMESVKNHGWMRGVVGFERKRWDAHAHELARRLPRDEWDTVADAFSQIAYVEAMLNALLGEAQEHLEYADIQSDGREILDGTIRQAKQARDVLLRYTDSE